MALHLYKTSYPNIKRNSKRHSPSSTYYVEFTWRPTDPEQVELNPRTGRPKRKRKRIPLGQFEKPEQARAVGLEEMRRVIEAPPGEPQERTLAELQRLQLESKTKLRPGTLKRYQLSDRNLQGAFGGDKKVSELTAAEVHAWVRKRQQTVKNGTINRDLTRLRTLISFALDLDWLEKDPIRKVESLEEPDARTRYLSEEEVRRLWSVCSPWLWRIVWFAAMTGMRKGEIFSLTWSQVLDGQIRLRKEQTKGKKPRTIPITPDIQAILDQVAKDHKDWVFVTEAKKVRINGNNFNQYWWRPALLQAGIKDFRFHDLRHTFCSWIVQSGGQLEKVQMLAGHSDFRTTQNYVHLAPDHLTATMALLSGRHPTVTPIGHAQAK